MPSWMGLDIGTTGTKAIVYSPEQGVVARAYREYPLESPREGWIELNPETVWASVTEVIRECNTRNSGPPVGALAISVLGEAVTPVDSKGRPLHNTIPALDTRTVEETEWLAREIGEARLKELTGQPKNTRYTSGRILWWKRHLPEVFRQARWFLCWGDLACLKLGLAPSIDHSMASRTQLFDTTTESWSPEVLSAIGLDAARLARPQRAGTVVGELPLSICQQLGFVGGVRLVCGGFDQACTALGVGATTPGVPSLGLGTVACLAVAYPKAQATEWNKRIMIYPMAIHVCPELALTTAPTPTGGQLLRWFRDQFCRWEREQAARSGENVYDLILSQAPSTPTNLFWVPHFGGTGTPWQDPLARGTLLGLTLRHTHGQIARAVLEGVTYEIQQNRVRLEQAGARIGRIRVSGGGARSALWMQILADVMAVPAATVQVDDAGCLGAALLAGVGMGAYPSAVEAARSQVVEKTVFEPNEETVHLYAERFEIYQDIYPALKELGHRMAALATGGSSPRGPDAQ